jgi:DNA replicative helicase MCM subunit Mcm2 (Cdc46/Mcm family)
MNSIPFYHYNCYHKVQPNETIPLFESAAKDALKLLLTEQSAEMISQEAIPDFQVMMKSAELTQPLRGITAEHVHRLIKVKYIYLLAHLFA